MCNIKTFLYNNNTDKETVIFIPMKDWSKIEQTVNKTELKGKEAEEKEIKNKLRSFFTTSNRGDKWNKSENKSYGNRGENKSDNKNNADNNGDNKNYTRSNYNTINDTHISNTHTINLNNSNTHISNTHINKTHINTSIDISNNTDVKPFTSFGDDEILIASAIGIKSGQIKVTPTKIQQHCIPILMEGRNLLVRAPTGTGKTLAYLYPLIKQVKPRKEAQLFVVVPTRELAEQVTAVAQRLLRKFSFSLRAAAVYGCSRGFSSYRNHEVLVATPGRLLDLLRQKILSFTHLLSLVLDEADELLNKGFLTDILCIRDFIKTSPQVALFSATYPPGLQQAIDTFLGPSPASVEVSEEVRHNIMHSFIYAETNKHCDLMQTLHAHCELRRQWGQKSDKALVFVETKEESRVVCRRLEKEGKSGVKARVLNGDLVQSQRLETINAYRTGLFNVLVATSVAARGIDVKGIKLVINYTMPRCIKEYIHRVGRTGREEEKGKAVSFYDSSLSKQMVHELIGILKESKNEVPKEFYAIANRNERNRRGKFHRENARGESNKEVNKGEKSYKEVNKGEKSYKEANTKNSYTKEANKDLYTKDSYTKESNKESNMEVFVEKKDAPEDIAGAYW